MIEKRREHLDSNHGPVFEASAHRCAMSAGLVKCERQRQRVARKFERESIGVGGNQLHREQGLHPPPQAQGIIHQARAGVSSIIHCGQRAI